MPLNGIFLIMPVDCHPPRRAYPPLGADAHARPIGRESHPVGQFDAVDHLHDLIDGSIDHVKAVARAVGDIHEG